MTLMRKTMKRTRRSPRSGTNLDLALATAFMHNSANPNVAALTSAPGPVPTEAVVARAGWRKRHAETLSDSPRVEVVADETHPHPPRIRQTGMSITGVSHQVGRGNAICTRRPVQAENDGAYPGMGVPQTSANKPISLTMRSRASSTCCADYGAFRRPGRSSSLNIRPAQGDHDLPARTQPSACVARSSRRG